MFISCVRVCIQLKLKDKRVVIFRNLYFTCSRPTNHNLSIQGFAIFCKIAAQLKPKIQRPYDD